MKNSCIFASSITIKQKQNESIQQTTKSNYLNFYSFIDCINNKPNN